MNVLPFSPEQSDLTHPKYRADIDGLRAVAVLSVVGFHAFPNWVKGGFVGVDIFFVISGYLISRIIIGNLENGTFSFAEFYARRVRRIFPALILVMVACYLFGWMTLLPDELKQLGKHIAAGAGFVSNLFFWQEAGYFDHAAQTKPLLHLWSLGVEEQFYIIWPLLLYLAWKRKFNFLSLATSIAIVSFAFSVWFSYGDISQAFYSPASRFWELMTGGILAYMSLHKIHLWKQSMLPTEGVLGNNNSSPKPARGMRNAQSILGALVICAAVLIITRDNMFPGWWVLLPTVGTYLVIAAGPHSWLNQTVLSNRLLVWFGLISYPLYLWHWPLLSFARIIEGKTTSPEIRVTAILISIVLAWLTYTILEKPIRFGKNKKSKTLTLLFLMIGTGLAGYFTYVRDGLEFRVHTFVEISKAAGEWQYPGNLKSFTFHGKEFLYQNSGNKNSTLFIGDSNMEQYYPRFDELIAKNPSLTHSVIFSTGDGCVPIPRSSIASYKYCFDLFDKSLDLALSQKNISTVVIGGLWYQYLSGEAISGEALSYFYAKDEQEYPIEMGSPGYRKALNALSEYIMVLKKNNKRVILILNIPMGDEMDPFYMVKRNLKNFPNVFEVRNGGINLPAFEDKYGYIKNDLIKIAKANEIEVIDPVRFLCSKELCSSVDADGEPQYKDGQHLRPSFVRNKATFVDSTVSN